MANSKDVSVAVIGGSGFYELPELSAIEEVVVPTPFGDVVLQLGSLSDRRMAFMARHGVDHKLPPHKINYRANMWALHSIGVSEIFAFNAVGGIAATMEPGTTVLPAQIIDYTYGREHTFASELSNEINHIDFTEPFSRGLSEVFQAALQVLGIPFVHGCVLGCTQGPRLETAAEVQRLRRDGCDVVGMTSMPEASLARELGMEYAAVCTVVNWAAGVHERPITLAEIHDVLTAAQPALRRVLAEVVPLLSEGS